MSRGLARSLPWLAVAAAAIAPYLATIGYGLAYDDKQIAMSPLLARPWDFAALLQNRYYPESLGHIALYRPLSQWSLLLNWGLNAALFGRGDVAWTFHAANVLLHAAASLLLFAWLRSLRIHPSATALFAALLFAVHPIHSEAVANVTARSEPQAFVLGLGFLLAHRPAHRRGRPILAALLFLLALWSKESAAAFFPLALAVDAVFPCTGARQRWRFHAAYAAVLLGWLALRALALSGSRPAIAFADNPVASGPWPARVLTAAAVQLDTLRQLVLPLGQSTDYAYAETVPVESLLDPRAIGFLLLAATALALAWSLRRSAPVVSLCVAGYALLFSTTSNFLFPIGTIRAERLAYAPSAFVCLLIAQGFAAALRMLPRFVPVGAAAGLVLAGGLATARASRVWRDEGTLARAAVLSAPRSAKAHRNLGVWLQARGDLAGAEVELARSASIYGGYGRTWVLLGDVRRPLGRTEAALEAWRRVPEDDPALLEVHGRIAHASLDLSRRSDAVAAAVKLADRDLFHPHLAPLQDRLAATASPEERAAALEDLAASERALAAGDASTALERARSAFGRSALPRAERARCLLLLSGAASALGQADLAERFARAAALLSGRERPTDPGGR